MNSATDPKQVMARLGIQFLVRGWLSANNIVFCPTAQVETTAVVDTGYVAHSAQTLALIQAALGSRPLDIIVNTHLHSDHCGGNAALQAQWPRCEVVVPHGYREALIPWNESKLSYQYTGQQCERFTPTRFIAPGSEIKLGGWVWEVYGTGGHDPDAVILFEPHHGILISGDALWSDRLAIVFSALSGPNGFGQAHDTLDLIEGLGPRVVLPGHGEAFVDVKSALAQSRQRLNAFILNPERHLQHAARALVMYRMLEVRRTHAEALTAWMLRTPIFTQTLCTGTADEAGVIASDIINRLVVDGALVRSDHDLTVA